MDTLTNEKINEIRSSVDIVDVVGKYLNLTKRGKNYFCECPFHVDKTPSLSVSSEKQIFTCFSCHRAGNVFNFLMEYDNLSFIEAVKSVADMSGINLSINNFRKTSNHTRIHDIYELSYKFYINNINTTLGNAAKDYLLKRNITDDIIKEFGIGLAIKSRDSLSKVLKNKNFNHEDIISSTLVIEDEKGYHDFFYDRIVFPLFDINNKVVGYSGRIYKNIDAPKYINSKEHSLFKKGEFLYNFYKAKEECRRQNCVIITEGFLDVIRCYSVGVKNVIATMGTAFTKQHIALIKRLAANVILCFDGDKAGIKASFACSEELIKFGIIPKIILLEDNLDPDDYILKKGKEKFIGKINEAMSVTDFKMIYHKNLFDLNSTEDKAKYVKKMIDELNKIDDEILREITIKKLSIETDLTEEFLKSKLLKVEAPKERNIKIIETNKYIKAQAGLIFYMLRNKEIIKIIDNRSVYFPDKNYRLLMQEIIYFYRKNNYIDVADILISLKNESIKLVGFIESLNFKENYEDAMIEDFIFAIDEKNTQDECMRLSKKMNQELNEDEKLRIGQKIMEILARREKDV